MVMMTMIVILSTGDAKEPWYIKKFGTLHLYNRSYKSDCLFVYGYEQTWCWLLAELYTLSWALI